MSVAQMHDRIDYDGRSWIHLVFPTSKSLWAAVGIAILYLIYNSFLYLDVLPLLPISELIWNALVSITPVTLAISLDRWRNPHMSDKTQLPAMNSAERRAMKSDALRRVFGFDSAALAVLPGSQALRRASWLGGATSTQSDAPAGLGNWDNSCYQNSVLQGLAALPSLTTYLETSDAIQRQDSSTTAGSLRETMTKLNHSENNGRRIWTPAKLKSMSSWQQQDAQEYFSRIMDDMEKETAKVLAEQSPADGLKEVKAWEQTEGLTPATKQRSEIPPTPSMHAPTTPLDGQLAQRVACLRCGFSEGLSMIPFNCLTVPLGSDSNYDLSQCLDSYTGLEEISGVECAKCTLLQQKSQLENMIGCKSEDIASAAASTVPATVRPSASLPQELLDLCALRLEAVQLALDNSDFSDATLNKKCQVPKKARISSTKTKQMVVARAPTGLVVHVNRSMFDEYTGAMRKNLAHVNYPMILDLGPWCLGVEADSEVPKEEWRMEPTMSMIAGSRRDTNSDSIQYILRAAVCHYGRHENGHYICYRQHPERQTDNDDDGITKMRWWRLSDDDVSPVTEDQMLAQGGVFMLFYERIESPGIPERLAEDEEAEEKVTAPTTVEEGKLCSIINEETKQDAIADITQGEPSVAQIILPETIALPESPEMEGVAQSTGASGLLDDNRAKPLSPTSESQQSKGGSSIAPIPAPGTKVITPPPTMRTARRGSKMNKSGFETVFRPVAAT